jgi:hypothetical protein
MGPDTEFDFLTPLRDLWMSSGVRGRRHSQVGTKELPFGRVLFKAGYAAAIKRASESAAGMPEPTTAVVIDRIPDKTRQLICVWLPYARLAVAVLATMPALSAFTLRTGPRRRESRLRSPMPAAADQRSRERRFRCQRVERPLMRQRILLPGE